MNIKNSKYRAFLKTITWRAAASTTTFILAMLFFSDDPNAKYKALGITLAETVIKMVLYYFHERIWQKLTKKSYQVKDEKVYSSHVNVDKVRRDVMAQKRYDFINNNRKLILEAKKERDHNGIKSKALVVKARKEIGYSSNTSACDIHHTLTSSIQFP